MDFGIFFRRFFNDHDNNNVDRDFFTKTDDCERNIRRDNTMFNDSEILESPDDIFHQMEEMFNWMFSFPIGMIGFPNFKEHMPDEQRSPRSIMLKESDEETSSSSVMKDFKESVISPFNPGKGFFEKSQSFSTFSSIKTIHLPDGTVEEHRTVVDSDGKKTTKVRRTIGGTSHEVITKSDDQGIKEKEENFINMDESELPDFEQKWGGLRGNTDQEPETPAALTLPRSSPTYMYLLKKFFGPFKKGEIESC